MEHKHCVQTDEKDKTAAWQEAAYEEQLVLDAIEARKYAYTPYSHFQVGAALLAADGRIIYGANIENASYGATNCAERTAFFKAVSEGIRGFHAIAIVGGPEGAVKLERCAPCGICRQVMMEFCDPKQFRVILGMTDDLRKAEEMMETGETGEAEGLRWESYTLEELLPLGFGPENLEEK